MNEYSRYKIGGSVDDLKKPGWWNRQIFTKSYDDVTITVDKKYSKKPHKIAYDYFGRSDVAWFVMQYNNILDVNELVEGLQIQLPTIKRFHMGLI